MTATRDINTDVKKGLSTSRVNSHFPKNNITAQTNFKKVKIVLSLYREKNSWHPGQCFCLGNPGHMSEPCFKDAPCFVFSDSSVGGGVGGGGGVNLRRSNDARSAQQARANALRVIANKSQPATAATATTTGSGNSSLGHSPRVRRRSRSIDAHCITSLFGHSTTRNGEGY